MKIDTEPKDWWKFIKVEDLKTVDECREVLFLFDDLLNSMNSQIETARIRSSNGNYQVDEEWYRDAIAAFGHARKRKKEISLRHELLRSGSQDDKKERQQMFYDVMLKTMLQIGKSIQAIEQHLTKQK